MTTKRRSLGFGADADTGYGNALDSLDPKTYAASKPRPSNDRPDPALTREAAKAAGFESREPMKEVEPAQVKTNRRRTTGRTDQFNVRTTTEVKEKFKALAASMNWSEAVTFEKAVELLDKQYNK